MPRAHVIGLKGKGRRKATRPRKCPRGQVRREGRCVPRRRIRRRHFAEVVGTTSLAAAFASQGRKEE